jgi:hypothetical protein
MYETIWRHASEDCHLQTDPVHAFHLYSFNIHFDIRLSFPIFYPLICLFTSGFPTKIVYALISYVLQALLILHLIYVVKSIYYEDCHYLLFSSPL